MYTDNQKYNIFGCPNNNKTASYINTVHIPYTPKVYGLIQYMIT